MACLKKIASDITKAKTIAKKLALENKCNFVVLAFRNKILYDKESCWLRDGKLGTLIALIEYENNL